MIELLGALETATPALITGGLHMHGKIALTSRSEPPRLQTAFEVYGFCGGDATPASTRSPAGLALNTAVPPAGSAPATAVKTRSACRS